MKNYIGLLLFMAIVIIPCRGSDHIILRNGQEYDVKLFQVNDHEVIFRHGATKDGPTKVIPSKDVYMIYIEKQGNVYITPEGKRITGENRRVDPKKLDAIYLINGAEIPASDVRITEDAIEFLMKEKPERYKNVIIATNNKAARIDKASVFMVRYRSGMIDIINPIEIVEEEKIEEVKPQEPEQPKFIVKFHETKKGETLEKVAAQYDVTVQQIVEWNELPPRIKAKTPLSAGMQLLIYQPKE